MLTQPESYIFKGQRKKLIQLLEGSGIADEKVLWAMGKVPRQVFVPSTWHHEAYENKALPLFEGQTISQPYTVAFMSQLLKVSKGTKVLEIGTGSGYQAAVLCEMGARVFSVERNDKLHRYAQTRLKQLGYEVRLQIGDGSLGWKLYQPYQRIVVTAASPQVPPALLAQLEPGGRLVAPVGTLSHQKMLSYDRISEEEFQVQDHGRFSFVPLIGKQGFEQDEAG
ncbi:MAG: protein-L-isoaspartate(D-aspartate) O-methyltransferase [Bacteroidota bacterium]